MGEVRARDPEVILDRGDMGNQSVATAAQKLAVVNLWRTYPMVKGVKQQRIVIMVPDIFFVPRPGPVGAAQAFSEKAPPQGEWGNQGSEPVTSALPMAMRR